jgi:predicted O-linked N-acetylglucosamine transferase (SPINDLY family)
LILKYIGLDDGSTSRRFLKLFVDQQVDAARIELRGRSGYDQMLAEYNEVDIALDPYPFCGATTSCEALWMGLPVVTCPRETFASRQTLGVLSSLGVTDSVASDLSQYVELAVSLAKDLPRLAELRAGLREQMAQSPLCDAEAFATSFMQAVDQAWRHWCEHRADV